jgi:hypothetical protein
MAAEKGKRETRFPEVLGGQGTCELCPDPVILCTEVIAE